MKCLICKTETRLVLQKMKGYMDGQYYDIYECPNCNISFSNPLKTVDFIYDSIYKYSQRIPGYSRYFKYAKNIKTKSDPLKYLAGSEPIYWSVKEFLRPYKEQNKKILEIGSGLGYLTYALNFTGYDCLGVDISSNAIEKAKVNFGNYYKSIDIFDKRFDEKFDLIIMTEVVEHVEDPVKFITRSKELLKNGGKLLLTTPNKFYESDDIVWVSDVPPVHLFSFSEKSFNIIGKDLDLSTDFIDFTNYNKKNAVYINKNFNKERHITFLKNHNRTRLNKDGSPKIIGMNSKISILFKKIIPENIKNMLNNTISTIKVYLNKDLTRYKGNKSSTLAVIYKKNI